MLCDALLSHFETSIREAKPGSPVFGASFDDMTEVRELRRAQRFVIAPEAARVVADLATPKAIARVRHAAIAPADTTWLEWVDPAYGGRIGILLIAANPGGPAVKGAGLLVAEVELGGGRKAVAGPPIHWTLAGPGPILANTTNEATMAVVRRAYPDFMNRLELERIGHWLVATLALIATPRLILSREADLTRLNKSRRRLGRREFLSHSEISLALGPKYAAPDLAAGAGARGGRARHHVRAHYRLLPGRVVLVRQHWRGDARRGVTRQRHTLRP